MRDFGNGLLQASGMIGAIAIWLYGMHSVVANNRPDDVELLAFLLLGTAALAAGVMLAYVHELVWRSVKGY